jgi:Ulp1 family protease
LGTGVKEEMSLDERMRLLLVGQEPEKDGTPLHPSKFITEKRTRLAHERKIKEREEAARAARELRLHRRFPTKNLVQELDAKWEDRVRRAEQTNSHHQVIATSIGGTELRIKDFRTLLGRGAWLNDEIVNSYLEWIVDAANKIADAESAARGEKASGVPKFIAHNSFFYNNLESKGAVSTERLMKRKKAPGKSVMEVDSVFVPICKGNHWTVGVVRPIAKTIEYFDSFGGSSQRFGALMRSWLKFQLGNGYVEEEWKVPITKCAPQSNGFDCGVFVCTNSLCVALGLDTLCYSQEDLGQQRRNIAAVLINKGFTGEFSWTNGGL